jgi:hypothetical protein
MLPEIDINASVTEGMFVRQQLKTNTHLFQAINFLQNVVIRHVALISYLAWGTARNCAL